MPTANAIYTGAQLVKRGFTKLEARQLMLISRRLHEWHELECGTDRGAIQRDEETGEIQWYDNHTWGRYYGQDTETSSLKLLAIIMKRHPDYKAYIQGDCRGCALYICEPGTDRDNLYSGQLAVVY